MNKFAKCKKVLSLIKNAQTNRYTGTFIDQQPSTRRLYNSSLFWNMPDNDWYGLLPGLPDPPMVKNIKDRDKANNLNYTMFPNLFSRTPQDRTHAAGRPIYNPRQVNLNNMYQNRLNRMRMKSGYMDKYYQPFDQL